MGVTADKMNCPQTNNTQDHSNLEVEQRKRSKMKRKEEGGRKKREEEEEEYGEGWIKM